MDQMLTLLPHDTAPNRLFLALHSVLPASRYARPAGLPGPPHAGRHAAAANCIFGTPPQGLVSASVSDVWSSRRSLLSGRRRCCCLPSCHSSWPQTLGGLGVTVMAGKAKMASASPVSTLGIVPPCCRPPVIRRETVPLPLVATKHCQWLNLLQGLLLR
jgi:hypothetical protein